MGWDVCYEIFVESGEGVEEVFRVVMRKLVERDRKMRVDLLVVSGGRLDGGGYMGLEMFFFLSVVVMVGMDD